MLSKSDNLFDISPSYLTSILRQTYNKEKAIDVVSYSYETLKPGLISGLGGGIYKILIQYYEESGSLPKTIILKANAPDEIVHSTMVMNAEKNGLGELTPLMPNLGFNRREILSYKLLYHSLNQYMPRIFDTVIDEKSQKKWIFMEDISNFYMANCWNNLIGWDEKNIARVVMNLAEIHSTFWDKGTQFIDQDWIIHSDPPTWDSYVDAALSAIIKLHPSYISPKLQMKLRRIITNYSYFDNLLVSRSKTVIHGDCTPRNMCFRKTSNNLHLVLYDWALTGFRPAQLDLAKFLLYVIDPSSNMNLIKQMIDLYINNLQVKVDRQDFLFGFDLACYYYLFVYLTVCSWRKDTEELSWLFREFRHRVGYAEQVQLPSL